MFDIPEQTLPPMCVLKAPLDRRRLYATVRRMAEVAGVPCPDTALLDDRGMEALQAACLGRPGPTNILSFPSPTVSNGRTAPAGTASLYGLIASGGSGGSAEGFRGCLALSVDTLEREAFLYGQEAAEYCIRLLAHGLAHLAGHDHSPAMRELEERLERAGRTTPAA
ncbi:MAG: rRNA maturation RNase YbeY [Desulfovibrio sp.]|jgi:probable rRNA maturation factor|nr:rRNA maturation RNase YbeY [Desulfovibrio sp.]